MRRDERWWNVYATIGELPITGEDIETGDYRIKRKLLEVHVRVEYDDMFFWSKQEISKEELELEPWLLGFTLDHCVKFIDDEMKRVSLR